LTSLTGGCGPVGNVAADRLRSRQNLGHPERPAGGFISLGAK
jgi:hypothetical protein